MIFVEKFMVNPLGENSYVLSDESGECIFIDPGFYFEEEQNEVKTYISEKNLRPLKITNTHCHFDHIMGVEFIRKEFNIPFYGHAEDGFLVKSASVQAKTFGMELNPVDPLDYNFQEGEKVTFGNSELEIIHVPGHSPGHVVFYSARDRFLIAGDVLFYGSIGRTDLPGGDFDTLISGIKTKLFKLPDETKVYSGHGPETTLGFEKTSNPFLTS
jgi:hydroxyacylglutathione hydrolase